MAHAANALLLQYVLHEPPLQHALPIVGAIHEMDHTQIHVIGVEACQQVLKGLLDFGNGTDTEIAAVLPGRAKVALQDPFLPILPNGITQVGADVGLGHEAVQNIHAAKTAGIHHSGHVLGGASLQPLTAQADLADPKAGIS